MRKQKKSVIIIAYHVLPYTRLWGAAQRVHYYAEHLIEKGYKVDVIGANFGVENNFGKSPNYCSYKVEIKPGIIQRYQESLNIPSGHLPAKVSKYTYSILGKMKKIIKYFYLKAEKILFNDFANYGFLVFLWNIQAKRVIKNVALSNNTNYFIISGPFFGLFSLTTFLKKYFPSKKIIIDYRDPWNLRNGGNYITRFREMKTLLLADIIVLFSKRFRTDIINSFKIDPEKTITVYNGYDGDIWEKIENDISLRKSSLIRDDKFVISYVSSNVTFTPGTPRDPSNLIKSVYQMDNASNVILNIVGCLDIPQINSVNDDVTLNLMPFVPHEMALNILRRSNLCVIISTERTTDCYTLTGKLFDCIRSKNPILGIANSTDVDYINIINGSELGATCQNNISEILNILNKQYNNWHSGIKDLTPSLNVKEFSRRKQNGKLISYLSKLHN